jgi:hypothetical protein
MNEPFEAGANIEEWATGYLVDTEKLRAVVYQEGIPPDLSHLIWTKLGIRARKPEGTDSFLAGVDIMEIYKNHPGDAVPLIKIMEDCRDMNKVPLVSIRGEPVDGTKFTFGCTTMPGGVRKFLDDNG